MGCEALEVEAAVAEGPLSAAGAPLLRGTEACDFAGNLSGEGVAMDDRMVSGVLASDDISAFFGVQMVGTSSSRGRFCEVVKGAVGGRSAMVVDDGKHGGG